MNRFRTVLLAVVTTAALMVPLANQPAAQAQGPHSPCPHAHHPYHVYYRATPSLAWVLYGTYQCRDQAKHVERLLRFQGFDAVIR
jgi:hypothetical protein